MSLWSVFDIASNIVFYLSFSQNKALKHFFFLVRCFKVKFISQKYTVQFSILHGRRKKIFRTAEKLVVSLFTLGKKSLISFSCFTFFYVALCLWRYISYLANIYSQDAKSVNIRENISLTLNHSKSFFFLFNFWRI